MSHNILGMWTRLLFMNVSLFLVRCTFINMWSQRYLLDTGNVIGVSSDTVARKHPCCPRPVVDPPCGNAAGVTIGVFRVEVRCLGFHFGFEFKVCCKSLAPLPPCCSGHLSCLSGVDIAVIGGGQSFMIQCLVLQWQTERRTKSCQVRVVGAQW